ncbi:MAG TPA: type 4a pilus biogenesis protein PilO [Nitrospiraceae bacterium]|nr:type 4a pilus biogenesis protein PilO [Nitrospiraceae bacterium]
MELPKLDLDALRKISSAKKLALLAVLIAGISALFYYYIVIPKFEVITGLQENIGKLDAEIQATSIKVQHLDELVAANKELEKDLEKKKERLPPEEEAVMLLKQLSDLGVRLGLDIKLWKPGNQAEDSSKLFVRMPVSVEVSGGYHTAAVFFDRIKKLPRIINVSDLRMGSSKVEHDHVVIQTLFELTAFVAPPEVKMATNDIKPVPVAAAVR